VKGVSSRPPLEYTVERGDETRKFSKAAKSSSILITEGTRVGREEQGNFQNRKFMKML